MKQVYLQPEIAVIAILEEDIIRTSGFEIGEELIPSGDQE